jgi:transcriptional regulator with GAF, ATPase, and Fis domain
MASTHDTSKPTTKTADITKISLISDACRKISLAVDLSEISRIAHYALSQILEGQDTLLGVINRQTKSLEMYCRFNDAEKLSKPSIALSDKRMPAIRCIESRAPVVIDDVANYAIEEEDSTIFRQLVSTNISSILCWPLVSAGQTIGVLCIHSYQKNDFSELLQQLVGLLSHALAGAIFHVNHIEEIDHQRRAAIVSDDHISTISEISREINSTLDLETVLWTVYQHVNKLMDATVFGIGIYDSDEELIKIDLAMEKGKRYQPYTRTMTDKNQFPVWCIENRESVFINDVRKEGGRYFKVNEYDNWEHNRPVLEDDAFSGVPLALIYVPMMLNDMVYGFITVQTFEANRYKKVHVDILRSIAGYTVNAIANASAHQELVQARESLRIAKREAEKTAEA